MEGVGDGGAALQGDDQQAASHIQPLHKINAQALVRVGSQEHRVEQGIWPLVAPEIFFNQSLLLFNPIPHP